MSSLVAQMVKKPPAMLETRVQSLDWEDLEKGMVTHFSILPGELSGQKGLAGYRPWGGKESDMTEWLSIHTHTHTHTHIHTHMRVYIYNVEKNLCICTHIHTHTQAVSLPKKKKKYNFWEAFLYRRYVFLTPPSHMATFSSLLIKECICLNILC